MEEEWMRDRALLYDLLKETPFCLSARIGPDHRTFSQLSEKMVQATCKG